MASNDPQRNRAKAHRAEISPWYQTNVGRFESKHGAQSASCCLKLRLVRSRAAIGNHWLPSSAAAATSREDQRKPRSGGGNPYNWPRQAGTLKSRAILRCRTVRTKGVKLLGLQ